jgi:hypothetical protein
MFTPNFGGILRTYENKLVNPFTIALAAAILITTNPLQIPRDISAVADEPVIVQPVLVERTPEAAQAYAKTKMADYGWTSPAQWSCLIDLWTGESNWRPDAFNKKAVYQNGERLHAGGIPQILGLDPDTTVEYQIEKGFIYIQSRYDTPCTANNFWHRNFWY